VKCGPPSGKRMRRPGRMAARVRMIPADGRHGDDPEPRTREVKIRMGTVPQSGDPQGKAQTISFWFTSNAWVASTFGDTTRCASFTRK
jgi:hypothetical protein